MKKFLTKASVSVGSILTAAQLTASNVLAQETFNLLGDNAAVLDSPPSGFASDIGSVIQSVLSFVMVLAALLVLMYLIWGGIEWITSGGDKSKTESARNKITAAVIGLIILAAAYAIFLLIIRFLGFASVGDIFNVKPINPSST